MTLNNPEKPRENEQIVNEILYSEAYQHPDNALSVKELFVQVLDAKDSLIQELRQEVVELKIHHIVAVDGNVAYEDRLRAVEAENQRLKEVCSCGLSDSAGVTIAGGRHSCGRIFVGSRVKELEAENAKLKEKVGDLEAEHESNTWEWQEHNCCCCGKCW